MGRACVKPGVEQMIGRAFQLLIGLATVGAVLHEGLGSCGAVLVSCTLLPVLAALAFVLLESRYLDLDGLLPSSAGWTSVTVTALALPAALLGWTGVGALLVLAVLLLAL